MSLGTQNEALLSYLLDDGPHPGEAALAHLAEAELPEGLAERTLNAVELERTRHKPTPQRPANWLSRAGIGLAVAAAIILVIRGPDETALIQGDLSQMTAKGEEHAAPTVYLKIAQVIDGQASRHRLDTQYTAGDQLIFRVQSSAQGWVTLLHVQDNTVQRVLDAPIQAGESDLAMPSGELAQWSFDSKDRSGFFAIVSSLESLPLEAIDHSLSQSIGLNPVDPSTLCLAAQSLGWQCDAIEVMVKE